ncbi:MAG: exostosin family protein [Alphaproteobacteria bacterium]
MFVGRPDRMLKGAYPNQALLDSLRNTRLADVNIPEDEILQFRKLQALIYALRVAGYDVEALSTEVFTGGCLLVPCKSKVIVTRCDFDMEVDDDVLLKIGVHLTPDLIWLTTNASARDPRVRTLPIGLTDYCGFSPYHAIIGDTGAFKALIDAHPRREDRLVLMNFQDGAHPTIRGAVRQLFQGKPFVTESGYAPDASGHARYVEGLRSNAFCLAPRGVGVDTHRMWESLYAGCIPIVQRSQAMKAFEDLPVFFVDRWEEACDEAVLKKARDAFHRKTWDLRKLTLSYWYAKICELGKVDPAILQAARN